MGVKSVVLPEVVQATQVFRRLSEVSSHLLPVLALRDLRLLKTPEGTRFSNLSGTEEMAWQLWGKPRHWSRRDLMAGKRR
jgi:hypothetical protein